ncbi:MAG: OmpA family protein, partial [Bacteroidales bacterium]|nr:OmpA family protein [Bacteroidales bacterium]
LYYLQDNNWGKAFFSSNRKEARALKQQSCCNDIFSHETEKIIPPEIIITQQVNILTLEASELIPITLFFDNDHPNPNSWDTTTSINYADSYEAYISHRKLFETEFSRGFRGNDKTLLTDSISRFFDAEVVGEYQKLTKFASLLKELVQKEQVIEVTIKGYTSPLHSTEYNEVLAKRRISSIENFFYEYDNGFFLPYIESKKIVISRLAFGKTMVRGNVSDDPRDRRNSVFSPAASAERKVQIVAVSVNKEE